MNANQEYTVLGSWGSEWEAHEFITQADYDNLTPAQKAEKVYMITGEGETPTPGGGSAEDTSYDNTTSGLTADNVQDAIDEVKSQTNNVINKVNYLEVNWWFFPLIADNIIYSGSSFSYLAEEDTLLYISDAADSYLKIDGGNIAGQYTPWYIHVAEWQTITYSENCKVYKANNTLVIDDTDVTLWLMDDKYLWPVNYQDNQVSAINSAHLGNNKVATATWTWDLEFHFYHEFNTQHSKMDEAQLVVNWNLTYGNMWTIESVSTFNDSFEKITTIDINVARNWYYTYNWNKYAIKVNTFDWSWSTTTYDIDLLQLNDNLEIVNTTNIHNSISWKYSWWSTSVYWKYIVVRDQSSSPSTCTAFKINDSLNWIIKTNEADGLLYSNRPTYPTSYNHFIYNNCIYSYGYNDYDSEYWCAPIITKQDTNWDLSVVFSLSMGYYKFSGSNWFIWIDTNNNDMYVMVTGRRSPYTKVYRKIDLNTLSQTSIDWTIFDQTSFKWLIWLLTIEWWKAIVHTYYNWSLINDKKIQNKNSSTNAITIYQMFINNTITYTAENVLFQTNILKVNNNNAWVYPIIWYSSSDSVSKILFWWASFSSTDTVDIDITIKNNSWESRTVTLPKSWWSVNSDTTTGTGTTFTFNS